MSNKEDKGLYRSHSRKELQTLCRRYGLPANRSRSDLAKSLTSYLENQRLGSTTTRERLYEIQEAGLPFPLNLPFRDVDKDFYGLISCPADSCNGGIYPQAVKCNSLGCCSGDKFYHKVDGVVPDQRMAIVSVLLFSSKHYSLSLLLSIMTVVLRIKSSQQYTSTEIV